MIRSTTFTTEEARDRYMDTAYPGRRATDVPGLYELPDGRAVGVFCNTVTLYEDDPIDEATGQGRR